MLSLDDLQFLLSAAGQAELARLANETITPANHLQLAMALRDRLTPARAQAVLELALLRQLGAVKFARADNMYFTRPALEQATAEPVAAHRALRFAKSGTQHVADLGCSIGGDAIALAEHVHVTGVEWDVVRLAMAQENVRVYGRSASFTPLQADIAALSPNAWDALFFDPARRDERGRRFYSVHQYQPPFEVIDAWRKHVPETAVKVSPGIDYAEIPDEAEIEFVSYQGDVKEGVLWFGALHSGVARRATCLPGNHVVTSDDMPGKIAVAAVKQFLYEPDGAVIRAHLVEAVAAKIGATKIDEAIAYLSGDTAVDTPYATRFRIEAHFPFQLKRTREALRVRKIGKVTIKKRGSPLDVDKFQAQLRLNKRHGNHAFLFLTHSQNQPYVLIGQLDE